MIYISSPKSFCRKLIHKVLLGLWQNWMFYVAEASLPIHFAVLGGFFVGGGGGVTPESGAERLVNMYPTQTNAWKYMTLYILILNKHWKSNKKVRFIGTNGRLMEERGAKYTTDCSETNMQENKHSKWSAFNHRFYYLKDTSTCTNWLNVSFYSFCFLFTLQVMLP